MMNKIVMILLLCFLAISPIEAQEVADSVSVVSDSIPVQQNEPIRKTSTSSRRKITPVDVDDNKPAQPILHYYDSHGNALKEPVLFLADLDTVQNVSSGPIYPLLNSVSVGLNFFDAIMCLAGQKHSSFDVWADLSLHNWFFPVVEAGVGFASKTPDSGNFTYKGKPSVYVKAGLNYNFLYKSNPDYQGFIGLRGCFSSFSYDVNDVTISNDYWGESNRFDITSQRASAFYGQFLVGIKVKILGNVSMGWTGRYNFKFHVSPGANGDPWFIPGYGTSRLNATFSICYTIPLSRNKELIH
jgi:hypothetical protein